MSSKPIINKAFGRFVYTQKKEEKKDIKEIKVVKILKEVKKIEEIKVVKPEQKIEIIKIQELKKPIVKDPMHIFTCPQCRSLACIYQKDINCGIFRHACYKDSQNPVDPHMKKEDLDKLIKEDKIYGCGKPFEAKLVDGKIVAKVCDYK